MHSLVSKTHKSPLLHPWRVGVAVSWGLNNFFAFMFADIDGSIPEKELPVLEECDI